MIRCTYNVQVNLFHAINAQQRGLPIVIYFVFGFKTKKIDRFCQVVAPISSFETCRVWYRWRGNYLPCKDFPVSEMYRSQGIDSRRKSESVPLTGISIYRDFDLWVMAHLNNRPIYPTFVSVRLPVCQSDWLRVVGEPRSCSSLLVHCHFRRHLRVCLAFVYVQLTVIMARKKQSTIKGSKKRKAFSSRTACTGQTDEKKSI